MKKSISIFCLLFVFTTKGFAQDYSFTNSNQSLLNINPSFAGSNGGLRVNAISQMRYPQKEYSSVGLYTTADSYLKKWNGGVALNYGAYDNTHGLETSQAINLTYAQHLTINKIKIIPSVQVGFFEKRFDVERVTYGQIKRNPPPTFPIYEYPNAKKQAFDLNGGLLVQYKTFYGGISAFHINQPDAGMWGTT